ncbi:uncharacterized protein GGS25DRAFT_31964 [Hypoxylon fragiforme]|uniref:uncharacterized protein n=1 Tax=Hypoxylon fragiforme TaxID=63214 RepID=UPI0020C61650|nr:uncharacterized protein GGS25DRAFT_31964 [Hypoxylon fragiforme]KAI2614051.1 hypothetical protein GGS25DRAFT_31964 [Hypoxylon fragiforme]
MDNPKPPTQNNTRVDLVASTGDITLQNETPPNDEKNDGLRGYFETAQWTADGTTILTTSSSHLISGYMLPEDLLSPTATRPLTLTPQATIQLPEPSNVLAGAPYFRLAEPWTQQLLVSSRDHPIHLFYLSPASPSPSPASCYPLMKAHSETFLTATSLIWPSPGTHFIAGTRNMLALFDVTRTNSEPLTRIKTIPSDRHLSKGGGVGMRGAVSCLSAQPTSDADHGSLVAAGTWTRWVGLYDFASPGARACVATWSITRAATATATTTSSSSSRGVSGADEGDAKIGGDGITQTLWSPCGRYLLVGERKSTGILVYDVRVAGKLLGWLSGREALGNQRISCDVFPGQEEAGGFEVWSGTTDGTVKVWEGVGTVEGAHAPAWKWATAATRGGSTVGSTCVHQSGSVVATCSGSWEFPDEDGDKDDDEDEIVTDDSQSQSSGSNSSSGGSSSDTGSDDSASEISWMRRRNKESSLQVWSVSNGTDEAAEP